MSAPTAEALAVEHVCDISVDLHEPQIVAGPTGTRMIYLLKEGRVEGERLRGRFVPGSGGDWLEIGSDGVGRVDVRVTLETGDGELVWLRNQGIIRLPQDGLARLQAGERMTSPEAYIRTVLRFETGAERYAWLNDSVFVGVNELALNHVDYQVFRLV